MEPLTLAALGVAGLLVASRLAKNRSGMASPTNPNGRSNFLPSKQRDQGIFDMVAAGQYVLPDFTAVQAVRDGHLVEVYAANDALRIGSADLGAPRAMVSHEVAQALADAFGLFLPTSRMSDMAYLAVDPSMRIGPITRPADVHMADEAVSASASLQLDGVLLSKGISLGAFSRVCGKEWITSERLLEQDGSIANVRGNGGVRIPNTVAGCNFGWQWSQGQSKSPGGVPCIQSPGLRHDLTHFDYSQWLTLYQPTCAIDGAAWNVRDALLDPSVAYLLSDEVPKGKACRVWRHPAMPLELV